MVLHIRIELDNAAFQEGGADEVARILESVASRIPDPLDQTGGALSLHDANGNYCGSAEILETSQEVDVMAALRAFPLPGSKGNNDRWAERATEWWNKTARPILT